MAKDPSPLLGYNNNIRHKNRVFHVQTEDSGVRHPHIITHLFMDGGRILKSVKTSYAEHLGVDKMADLVRKMMKDQHKGMLIALRDGQFDQVIDGGESKPAVKPALAAPPAAAPRLEPPQPETLDAIPAAVSPPAPPAAFPSAPRPLAPAPTERIDLAEFERAVAQAPAPIFEPASDLQPPPANLFRPRTGGNYSTVVNPPPEEVKPAANISSRPAGRPASGRPAAPAATKPASVPPGITVSRSGNARPVTGISPTGARQGAPGPRDPRRSSSPPPPVVDPTSRIARRPPPAPVVTNKAPESRYASARPAAIFGQAKPRSGSSIFGEDIISDKSLDEVIMSYLADDAGSKASEATKVPEPKRRK